ncbi:thiol:disulfide interchange protein DsbC [Nitrosomonas cryotolerans]|uniref:Thiol:disulfide interchange protein n=1 Tax=Nitrosomonas cryotolerans ATCC 49181 TaxID=1131553 RepID=A0A1N6GS02_9PROT|nr:DsbC family protein [Nitrosomonas cryotolerans]SFP40242.1 thiol:disulfide interchange protein DsbC [Nitrosomonas cryotolerans]SIO10351.1 thiol:disulfide interchange protein DsbC [Nitrosomonas cryotolerans ATCC 49181]
MRLSLLVLILLVYTLPGMVLADQSELRESIGLHFPVDKIESLKKTPYLGLYEVVVDGEIFYTDATGNYFFFGHVVDGKTRKSLTGERLQEIKDARRIALDSLPLELAIKTIKGNGERILVVFTDPNCPYCKQLEKELTKVTDVTIYTLLYPILNGSVEVAAGIWCATDRVKAWDDFMLRNIAPKGKDCETPLATLLQAGKENKVNGTPTLIFADGSVVGGMIPIEMIVKKLDSAIKNH